MHPARVHTCATPRSTDTVMWQVAVPIPARGCVDCAGKRWFDLDERNGCLFYRHKMNVIGRESDAMADSTAGVPSKVHFASARPHNPHCASLIPSVLGPDHPLLTPHSLYVHADRQGAGVRSVGPPLCPRQRCASVCPFHVHTRVRCLRSLAPSSFERL